LRDRVRQNTRGDGFSHGQISSRSQFRQYTSYQEEALPAAHLAAHSRRIFRALAGPRDTLAASIPTVLQHRPNKCKTRSAACIAATLWCARRARR
jgi:hypothetical protein